MSSVFDVFVLAGTPDISDAMGRAPGIKGVRPIVPGVKMVGRAFTVRTVSGDWAKPVEAIEKAEPGMVIVIDAQGGGRAVWGELASKAAYRRGIAGVVVYGNVRDVDGIRKLGFPVFALGVVPEAGDPRGIGELKVELELGGVRVRPGDWIVGDDNGVVVIPAERAEEVAERVKAILKFEKELERLIDEGKSLPEALGILGYELG